MIEVKNLSKYYGSITAINDISFNISQGDIIGFLGPNGAGKTTTMKILTCFMRPTKGSVKIGGYDIYDAPIEVKKLIGYLPESNPLYYDMKVINYLKYICKLKELSDKDLNKQIDSVIDKCGLEEVFNRKIGNLSKGYKQRVGLAQAIISDPPILILDEPTSGLDPNQIIEIRELIKDLGKEKTVILSTHILPEVETTCNRIIIINNGRLVADGTKEELSRAKEDVYNFILSVKYSDEEKVKNVLDKIEEIKHIKLMNKVKNILTFEIETGQIKDINEKIFFKCVENNFIIYEFKKVEYSLEDIFKNLTLQ
jgi:ABC-2 type transport system ATP-binding protein